MAFKAGSQTYQALTVALTARLLAAQLESQYVRYVVGQLKKDCDKGQLRTQPYFRDLDIAYERLANLIGLMLKVPNYASPKRVEI